MPPLETNMVYQKAVLWAVAALSDRQGEHCVYMPIEITVRWEDTYTEVKDPQGNLIAIDAVAYVLQDIMVGSMMWLGPIANLPATGTFQVKRVVHFDTTADIKGRNIQRNVSLSKQSYTLPAIVGTGS